MVVFLKLNYHISHLRYTFYDIGPLVILSEQLELLGYQVSLVVSGSSSQLTTGGHLRSRVQVGALMGTSALFDEGAQPVVVLDCLYPINGR